MIIEGVSRKYCQKHGLKYDSNGSKDAFRVSLKHSSEKWRDEIVFQSINGNKLILPSEFYDERFLRRTDEGFDLLLSFKDFGIDHLYKSTSNKIDKPILSRHDIIHGKDMSYINELNVYRLLSCMEALVFAITLNPLK